MTFIDADDTAVARLWRRLARMTHEQPDAGLAEHTEAVRNVLAAADERDAISDARDAAAEQRERELDLAEMLNLDGTYGEHWAEWREATLARLHAKDDRTASREDRIALAQCLLRDARDRSRPEP